MGESRTAATAVGHNAATGMDAAGDASDPGELVLELELEPGQFPARAGPGQKHMPGKHRGYSSGGGRVADDRETAVAVVAGAGQQPQREIPAGVHHEGQAVGWAATATEHQVQEQQPVQRSHC